MERRDSLEVHITPRMVNAFKHSSNVRQGGEWVTIYDFAMSFPAPLKVYIGEDPKQGFKGNAILLQTGPRKFVYIGELIYEFEPQEGDEIESFVAWMGNSNVPYPIAYGRDYRYHLSAPSFEPRSDPGGPGDEDSYPSGEDLAHKVLVQPPLD